MKILAVGDSFTYGEELADRNLAWPTVLANKLNGIAINNGQPGGSNDCIIRTSMDYLLNDTADLVVIGWTSPGRTEFVDGNGYYDVWPGYQGKLIDYSNSPWRKELTTYINNHHSVEAYYEKFLNQILMMQGFLKSRSQKYVMMNILQNEFYKEITPTRLTAHYTQVDRETFIGFGESGMMEWAYGCVQGPYGHFLEDGHQIVADKIYEHIRHLGWIS